MDDKDPNYMTVSELMRWAANDDEYISPIDGNSWTTCSGKLKSFVEWESGDWPNDARLCDCLADKIDAEIEAALLCARSDAFLENLDKRIEMYGYPSRKNETLAEWLERCFIPRPRFEDGEPVQPGDEIDFNGHVIDVNEAVILLDGSGYRLLHSTDCATAPIDERVKRPAPERLGADGLPIKAGETVWHVINGREATVANLKPWGAECDLADGMCVSAVWAYENITHTPPDTQERIDGDATLPPREYYAEHIGHDVGLKDDEEVVVAMVRDLLLRQRELDKRTGGAE